MCGQEKGHRGRSMAFGLPCSRGAPREALSSDYNPTVRAFPVVKPASVRSWRHRSAVAKADRWL